MKKIALVVLLAAGLAACEGDRPTPPVPPTPAPTTTPPDEGGPCGDGTILGPNEECP